MKIILASKSPRRIELLKKILADLSLPPEFERVAADINESVQKNESPTTHVERLAKEKAQKVAAKLGPHHLILAADTVVVLGRKIFGKPVDKNDAKKILRELSDKKHEVITGFCLLKTSLPHQMLVDHDISRVWFKNLSENEIETYVNSNEPMDKAGAYAVQGLASQFVTKIEGSFTNIMGLPTEKIARVFCLNPDPRMPAKPLLNNGHNDGKKHDA